ncbi:MAG: hypothetical protein HQK81_02840 [Desulfovibrionaceae bacterium]|nr:hypothetical protein [Desulfovibrionaceae bacterium]MBF0512982.1 hypothetical protein [Desulfovibrionaceae bacterium]
MIRNVWSVMCSMALTDKETGSVSYIRCVEYGGSPVIPAVFPMLVVGTMWEKIDSDRTETMAVRIVFVTPSKAESTIFLIDDVEVNLALQKMNFHLPGVQTEEFGRHELRVEYKQSGAHWLTAAILPLYINKAAIPPHLATSQGAMADA